MSKKAHRPDEIGYWSEVKLDIVFPRCQFSDYHRALCLLDPYGLSVNWEVLRTAGGMRSVEVFYNFMIMDANMNVFMKDPGKVTPEQAARMDAVWGDNSWRLAAYRSEPGLFGDIEEKSTNEAIAGAFSRCGTARAPWSTTSTLRLRMTPVRGLLARSLTPTAREEQLDGHELAHRVD